MKYYDGTKGWGGGVFAIHYVRFIISSLLLFFSEAFLGWIDDPPLFAFIGGFPFFQPCL